MKFLVLLCLAAFASANYIDELEDASNEVVADFMLGMERSPSLKEFVGEEFAEEADQIDEDVKTELGKSLREALDNVLEKIRTAVDHGKEVSKDLADKAKEITQKLKDLGLEAGSKAKEIAAKLKDRAKEWLKKLLEKIGIGKRGIGNLIHGLLEKLNLRNLIQTLNDKVQEKIDIEMIKEYIKKIFGEKSQLAKNLIETLKNRGVEALKRLIKRILPSTEVAESAYSLSETWEKIKDFFKGLGVQIREKFSKFADWLKNTVKSGFEGAKDKAAKLKALAKQVISHGKDMSAEVAREALEFFRPYKEDLGSLWDDLKEAVKKAIGKDQ